MKDQKINKAFGIVLKRLRKKAHLSQEELAFRCGLHHTYISQMERGMKTPTLTTINRISWVFGLKMSELIQLAENEIGETPLKAIMAVSP